jgi:hypothetical protein
MNWQAFFDGLLAAVALWVALRPARGMPALQLGCVLLGCAATLGTLRFSGLLPMPQLHQYFSMLGAGVGLPLLAIAVVDPRSAIAGQRRYTWIFAVTAAVVCTLVVMILQFKAWVAVSGFVGVLAVLVAAVVRKQRLPMLAGVCMVAALALFAAKFQAAGLQPGDFLHIGLALGLLMLGLWAQTGSGTRPLAQA